MASKLSLAINLYMALVLQPVTYPTKIPGPFKDPANTNFSRKYDRTEGGRQDTWTQDIQGRELRHGAVRGHHGESISRFNNPSISDLGDGAGGLI